MSTLPIISFLKYNNNFIKNKGFLIQEIFWFDIFKLLFINQLVLTNLIFEYFHLYIVSHLGEINELTTR